MIEEFNVTYKKESYRQLSTLIVCLEKSIDDIWTDFRCGFVHYLAPKSQHGIIRGSENPYFQKIEKQYNSKIERQLMINLDLFWQDFQEAVRKYYNELLKDEGLKRNFFKRIDYLTK